MSLNEKEPEISGLTIARPELTHQTSTVLATIEDVESTHSGTPTLTPQRSRTTEDRESSPFSPFYSHPTTRYSLEANKSDSKQNITVYESDVEACLTDSNANVMSSSNLPLANKECTVWPRKQALLEKKKAARQKGCNPMRNLDKRTKIWVKALIGLLVIGLAVGVGVGISKAVGGGIWNSDKGTKPIS